MPESNKRSSLRCKGCGRSTSSWCSSMNSVSSPPPLKWEKCQCVPSIRGLAPLQGWAYQHQRGHTAYQTGPDLHFSDLTAHWSMCRCSAGRAGAFKAFNGDVGPSDIEGGGLRGGTHAPERWLTPSLDWSTFSSRGAQGVWPCPRQSHLVKST